MTFVSPGIPVPCCVDVDESYASKARYALRMLLVPLGLEPDWVDPERAAGALYYGRDASRAQAARGILAHAGAAAGFFAGERPFDPEDAVWKDVDGETFPVMFTDRSGRPDYVASAFLWLSGWQESADARRDEHGRVCFAYTLNAQLGTVLQPVVDAYREAVAGQLDRAGVEFRRRRFDGHGWAFCPTHDVDYLRKWRAGILYREFVEHLLLNRRRVPPRERVDRIALVVRQIADGDPYVRALYAMPPLVADRGGTATYFVKSGGGDAHDVRYRIGSAFMREWMRQVQEAGFEVGLHPSYTTVGDEERLRAEKERLDRVAASHAMSVRQHYLRFDPRSTPRMHEMTGFAIDSTIGYAEREGFRRGTCLPYQLYDLAEDRPLDVWEMPLSLMDSALFNRRGLGLEAAKEVTQASMSVCRRYGGVLVGLWHTTLGDEIDCRGWHAHFVHALDEARTGGAYVGSLVRTLESWG